MSQTYQCFYYTCQTYIRVSVPYARLTLGSPSHMLALLLGYHHIDLLKVSITHATLIPGFPPYNYRSRLPHSSHQTVILDQIVQHTFMLHQYFNYATQTCRVSIKHSEFVSRFPSQILHLHPSWFPLCNNNLLRASIHHTDQTCSGFPSHGLDLVSISHTLDYLQGFHYTAFT